MNTRRRAGTQQSTQTGEMPQSGEIAMGEVAALLGAVTVFAAIGLIYFRRGTDDPKTTKTPPSPKSVRAAALKLAPKISKVNTEDVQLVLPMTAPEFEQAIPSQATSRSTTPPPISSISLLPIFDALDLSVSVTNTQKKTVQTPHNQFGQSGDTMEISGSGEAPEKSAYDMLKDWRPPKVKLQLSKENHEKIAAMALDRQRTLSVTSV